MNTHALVSLLASGFWRASWQAGLLAAAVLIARSALGARLSPAWRCAIWMLVAARLTLPVVPASAWSVFNLVPDAAQVVRVAAPQDSSGAFVFIHAGKLGLAAATDVTAPSPRSNWTFMLEVVWLVGAISLAARLLLANPRFARRLVATQIPTPEPTAELCRQCADEIGIRRVPEIIVTKTVSTPALFGLWRPRLLLPPDFSVRLTPHEARLVFLHELAHVRRRDLAAGWVMSLLQIVHWFNPLVWISGACWRADMEAACDQAVLAKVDEQSRTDYGLLLVKLAASLWPSAPPPALAIVDGKAELRRRIAAIARSNRPAARWSLAAAALLAALALAGLTDARGQAPAAPTTAPQANELEVYTVRDLLSHPANFSTKDNSVSTKGVGPMTVTELADLIKGQVTPEVWSSGSTIDVDERTGELVVQAPSETQAAVIKLLDSLRKGADTAVTVSAYICTIDPNTARSLNLPPEISASDGRRVGGSSIMMLTNDRLQLLLQKVENAGANKAHPPVRAGADSILASPRITAKNHEECSIEVGSETAYVSDLVQTSAPGKITVTAADGTTYAVVNSTVKSGFKLTVKPDISADGKYVTLGIKADLTDLLGFQTTTVNGNPDLKVQTPQMRTSSIAGTVSVPNGGTVVMNLPVAQDDAPGSTTNASDATTAPKAPHPQVELILTAKIVPPRKPL
ncbi:MAG: M56 family metallopeptidase [Tepidisphaeraceae bacterium]|jgi:beta-lactamase regulating signal transducer with metallopeptidase domain